MLKCRVNFRSRAIFFSIVAFALLSAPDVAVGACVTPLSPNATDADQWSDVSSAPILEGDGFTLQSLDRDGFGQTHLDYDAVIVSADMSAERYFAMLRSRLASLLVAPTKDRRLFAVSAVGSNRDSWFGNSPNGVLLRFTLLQFPNSMSFEHDDFVVSCADETSITIATVGTKEAGRNALSGIRGIGVVQNQDGTITVFTKAAMRLTNSPFRVMSASDGEEIFKNRGECS